MGGNYGIILFKSIIGHTNSEIVPITLHLLQAFQGEENATTMATDL